MYIYLHTMARSLTESERETIERTWALVEGAVDLQDVGFLLFKRYYLYQKSLKSLVIRCMIQGCINIATFDSLQQ